MDDVRKVVGHYDSGDEAAVRSYGYAGLYGVVADVALDARDVEDETEPGYGYGGPGVEVDSLDSGRDARRPRWR